MKNTVLFNSIFVSQVSEDTLFSNFILKIDKIKG